MSVRNKLIKAGFNVEAQSVSPYLKQEKRDLLRKIPELAKKMNGDVYLAMSFALGLLKEVNANEVAIKVEHIFNNYFKKFPPSEKET